MTMFSSDLAALERLATGADAGKWSQLVHSLLGNNFGPFIKAAHPARILELIAEIRRLQKEEQAAVLLADALDTIASITTSPAGDALAEMEPEAMLRAAVECAAEALRLWHDGERRRSGDEETTIERLRTAMQEAVDLLAERTHGSDARSPGHNARLCLETALAEPERIKPPKGST